MPTSKLLAEISGLCYPSYTSSVFTTHLGNAYPSYIALQGYISFINFATKKLERTLDEYNVSMLSSVEARGWNITFD
jgi:hypothetical protein